MDFAKAQQILDLTVCGSLKELKAHFYKRAHDLHPDKNPGRDTQAQFRELLKAYEYVAKNWQDLAPRFGAPAEPASPQSFDFDPVENLDDIFEDIFGFSQTGRVLGYEEPQELVVDLMELVLGGDFEQKMVSYKTCGTCDGSGSQNNSRAHICTYCFGSGSIEKHKSRRKACPKCKGRGRVSKYPCEHCNGFGRLKQSKKLRFQLPPGAQLGKPYTLDSVDAKTGERLQLFVKPVLSFEEDDVTIDGVDLMYEHLVDFKSPLNTQKTHYAHAPERVLEFQLPDDLKEGDIMTFKGYGLYQDYHKGLRGDLRLRFVDAGRGFLARSLAKVWGALFGK